ncbi:MAG: ABC transporter substrate-binding protein, partial [Desulfamplus sp.]|nr:ABC transporter substrate-binding protein [Desulfamplus sp.]
DKTPIQMVSWDQGYNLASTKPNVVLFSTTFTEERRTLFKWVGPVAESVWVLYAKAGSGIKLKSLEAAKRLKKIGTYKDDVREQFLKEKGFTNLESVTDDSLNLKKLMDNSIDLWVSSRDRVPFVANEMGIPMESIEPVLKMVEKGLFIVFNAETPDDIVDKWAVAYDQLKSGGTMEAIYKKWNVTVPTYQIPVIQVIED